MAVGAFLEPLTVIVLLFGGAWINRASDCTTSSRSSNWEQATPEQGQGYGIGLNEKDGAGESHTSRARTRSSSPSLLPSQENRWRSRHIILFGYGKTVATPNTAVFRNRLLSRLLYNFPFLVEAWYWALIYWVYQLGRAFSALTLVEGTVEVARRHALQVIEVEKRLNMFWELPIQRFFLQYPQLMTCINWLYSFIHIPGTIAFLVWLYHYTITSNRQQILHRTGHVEIQAHGSPAGPALYEARRRTMAVCNLLAFIVFTLWPCMPPRLLSDKNAMGPLGEVARSYGFVDTVHSKEGASSVWTQNRFCNQYAAMPSLHFGYSLLVGITIMTIPLAPEHRRRRSLPIPLFNQSHPDLAPRIRLPPTRRMLCMLVGFAYPTSILIAIVSTANHFILDAVAGAMVCFLGWKGNRVLLNLLPVEDYFLWCLRIHKPVQETLEDIDYTVDDESSVVANKF